MNKNKKHRNFWYAPKCSEEGIILSKGMRWESVKRLRLKWTLRDGMPDGETGDKHLPKTCWPTEWRAGMWGISICQSTAWRGCMKWTREWGAYDGVGTCTHWGAVGGFSTPIAQSDPDSFDYTGGCVEKKFRDYWDHQKHQQSCKAS